MDLGLVLIPEGFLCLNSFPIVRLGNFRVLDVSPNFDGDKHESHTIGRLAVGFVKPNAVLVISTAVGGRLMLVPNNGVGGDGGGARHCSHKEDAVVI